MVPERYIHWLAGILDGEGTFIVTSKDGTPRIALQMTDQDTVTKVAYLLGAASVRAYPARVGGSRSCSAMYACAVEGRRAVGWMMVLFSLLSSHRREQIKLVLRTWSRLGTKSGLPYRKSWWGT